MRAVRAWWKPAATPGPRVRATPDPDRSTVRVIHYHVGIRHYAVTAPVSFAACLTDREVDTASAALGSP